MPFKLAPQPIPDNFRWRGQYFHLTYANWVELDAILQVCDAITSVPIIGYSFVWEDTTYKDVNGMTIHGHNHTHFACMFHSRINVLGSRKFDVQYYDADGDWHHCHPNIQPKVTVVQMEQIFTHYHQGRKFDISTGKMQYTKPIRLEQKLPPLFEFNRAVIEDIIAAPSLLEAVIAGEVRPRTVMDVKVLRDDHARTHSKKFNHMYPASSFHVDKPDFTALHLHGPSGLGKTRMATAWFDNPCFVKPFDSIGCLERLGQLFDPQIHDGIVCDEADLRFLTTPQAIALLDFHDPCTLSVRFKSITIPSGVKKIFISNPPPSELYPCDPHGAIARRRQELLVMHPTWMPAPCTPSALASIQTQNRQCSHATASDSQPSTNPTQCLSFGCE